MTWIVGQCSAPKSSQTIAIKWLHKQYMTKICLRDRTPILYTENEILQKQLLIDFEEGSKKADEMFKQLNRYLDRLERSYD